VDKVSGPTGRSAGLLAGQVYLTRTSRTLVGGDPWVPMSHTHLRRQARRVSEAFAHVRACPDKTTAHSCDASVPADYRLAESARSHDGAVTSITTAEMPVPITALTFTTTAIAAPTKHPQATTATITSKISQASLQLTHELEGYIRQMRSRAPTKNMKNTTNTKIFRLSLSSTPQLPLRLGGY
jgi:hypothetical protein